MWKHEHLRRAGLTELIFRLFCQGETKWIRESALVQACSSHSWWLFSVFYWCTLYCVPITPLVVNFKSCFVLLLKFCFLNGVFFLWGDQKVFCMQPHVLHIYLLLYFFIFMLSLLVISILMKLAVRGCRARGGWWMLISTAARSIRFLAHCWLSDVVISAFLWQKRCRCVIVLLVQQVVLKQRNFQPFFICFDATTSQTYSHQRVHVTIVTD